MIENKPIFFWLLTCILLVYSMIVIGGYTRLTHSGLSIVEWKPITGTLPPLNEVEWNIEFSKYKESPEYKKINYNFDLTKFKKIFLIEYFHRLLGRITGIAFLLPFFYFAFSHKITKKDIIHFSGIAILIAIQGAIGWFMVKSGLIDQPNVSQYRLAIHLLTACIIITLLTLKLFKEESSFSTYGLFSVILLLLQITSGAFVAGLRAGLIYNTFPLMNNQLIPEGIMFIKPWYINFFENIATVQFIHRLLGIVNVINIFVYSYKINNRISIILICIVLLQFLLGILTLLTQVPLELGLLHQAIAVILLFTLSLSISQQNQQL